MIETINLPIKGITSKAITLICSLGIITIGAWYFIESSIQSDVKNLITLALMATLIAPLSIITFIHFYAGSTPARLFEHSNQLIKYIALIVTLDFALIAIFGNLLSISLSLNPSSYFVSFLLIIFGCVIFIFNIDEIRDQLENRNPQSKEWTDALLLLTSTFWIFVPIFFFAERSRK